MSSLAWRSPGLSRLGQALRSAGISIFIPIPQIFSGWLLAAPKKKTSHMKKRQRQLAGNKQIKQLHSLNRCPACGHYKRAHTLCMNCVREIQKVWKSRDKVIPDGQYEESSLSLEDRRQLYPGRVLRPETETLLKKEYLYKRPRTLKVEKS